MNCKSAVITGASSGIGKAVAVALANAGYHVALLSRRDMTSDTELFKACPSNVRILSICCDVTKLSDIEAAVQKLETKPEFKNLTVLVNNAGLALGKEPADVANLEDWETMIDTNVKGLVRVTRLLLPALKRTGSGASIINLGSMAGRWPYVGGNVYGATKAFVLQFSLNLRMDLQGTGIRVTDVEPGAVQTNFSLVRFKGDTKRAEEVYAGKAPLMAEDIADTIRYIVNLPPHVCIPFIEIMPTKQVPCVEVVAPTPAANENEAPL